jgi:predicted secreted protein
VDCRATKHFLTLADSEVERDVNGEKAVTWLIQASRQGNDEATKLLQKCQKTKTGKGDNYKIQILVKS